MARLPQITPELNVTPQVHTSVSASEVALANRPPTNPYSAIADSIGQLGAKLTDIGANYERATAAANLVKESQAARNFAQQAMMDANGNPDTFMSAWDSYAKTRRGSLPPKLATAMDPEFALIGGDTYRQIKGVRFAGDIASNEKTIRDEIAFQNDALSAMARGGQTGTPEWNAAAAKKTALYNELTANPLFNYPQAQADIAQKQEASQQTAEAIIGHAITTYNSPVSWKPGHIGGGLEASAREGLRLLTDPKLDLNPAERQQFYNRYSEQISTMKAQRTAERQALEPALKDMNDRLDLSTKAVSHEDVQAMAQKLAELGDAPAVLSLLTKSGLSGQLTTSDVNNMTPEQNLALAQGRRAPAAVGAGLSAGTVPADALAAPVKGTVANLLNLIASREAPKGYEEIYGGRVVPGLSKMTIDQVLAFQRSRVHAGSASSATGRYQFIQGTLASLKSQLGLSGNEVFSPQMQDRLAVSLMKRRGLDAYVAGKMSATDFANNLAKEWASLPVVSGPGVGRSFYAGDGLNASFHSPDAILAALGGVNSADVPTDPVGPNPSGVMYADLPLAVAKQVKTDITESFKQHIDAMTAGVLKNDTPSQTDWNLTVDMASVIDDQPTRDKLANFALLADGGRLLDAVPPDQKDVIISNLRNGLTHNGQDGMTVLQQSYFDGMQKIADYQKTQLASDPVAYGFSKGVARLPLDFTDPVKLTAAFSQGDAIAGQTAARYNLGDIPALTKPEQGAVTAQWAKADTNGRIQMLASLTAGIQDKGRLMATLATFADNKQTAGLAVAGALAETNPEAAGAIIRGEKALQVNPDFGFTKPSAPGAEGDDATVRSDYYPNTTMPAGFDATWNMHLEAAKAIYADASSQAGDVSGKFNVDRWKAAVDSVTGGIVEFNGGKVIAPRADINQKAFDDLLSNLPNGALAGAVTPDGTPLTIDFLRNRSTLKSVGDGRYAIELGIPGTYALRVPRGLSEVGVGGPFGLEPAAWPIPAPASSGGGGPSGPASADEFNKAMSDYQNATGAGNTAPPPLNPR